MSEYLHLVQQNRLPQSYAYASRVGFSPGLIGGECASVVLPPVQLPGRSRLKLWYRLTRDRWIKAIMREPHLEAICKRGAQYWLHCVFRWMHFLRQQEKMDEERVATNQDFKTALQKTILQVFTFRLEYVVFYCHLRRVWQEGRREQLILPDPYGLCPRVCSDRSGTRGEDDGEVELNRGLAGPEHRLEQCAPSIGQPTILTSSCFPDPHVGLHTSISFSCQCPAHIEYKWMCGPKMCSFHLNWRMPGYWQEIDEEIKQRTTMWRFDPPSYYKYLQCSREGTLDIAYVCINDKGHLTSGFVKPHCRKAEYCVCKPQYYGALCDKIKNPCEQAIGNLPSGDIACRVVGGNKCIADMGSGSYSCQCLSSFRRFRFTEGPMMGRDNCAEQVDVCQKAKCQHGTCISASEWNSEVGRVHVTAKCLCENGWRGRLCNHPYLINNWTPWTSWSLCQPSCQHSVYSGNRYRHRKRRCLDPYRGDCQFSERENGQKGSKRATPEVVELRLCRPRPCDRYLKLVSQSIENAPINASRRAGLLAKERHLRTKEGDGNKRETPENKPNSNANK
ncbi:acidic fibroblast growth factor intracellular binding [Echinococcus granulosus]|uniref:Acidic fibroblast growth factor intracellular binding n=1 Tax=Echinococcus granulosus TaxID=6210 RepID=W6USQ0_ECHGR|nr:acidic fibroblast growth factor intracellular binding [Echinococcus granulosus]EUB63691.1 acidic fibroblast growth factor intracellular binding [Echinococcus granulosus]